MVAKAGLRCGRSMGRDNKEKSAKDIQQKSVNALMRKTTRMDKDAFLSSIDYSENIPKWILDELNKSENISSKDWQQWFKKICQ